MGSGVARYLAVGFSMCFAAVAVHAREFRAAEVQPGDYPTVMYVKRIGEIINQKSNGKFSIKVFGNSALGSEKDTVEQVKIGAVDMVRVNTSAFHSIIPETMIPAFPFIFRDVDHFRKTMYGAPGEKILSAFDKVGYVGLTLMESGPRSLYAKRPVRSLADVKGMKIRVQPSELMVSLVQAMGANPTPIPYAEVYTALKTNLVDAAENNYSSYETAKHYESAPVYSETAHIMGCEVLVFSKKVWDKLTQDEQKMIRDAVIEARPYYIDLMGKTELSAKDSAKKLGATFVEDVNRQEFVTAMKPVWDKFATTAEQKSLVQQIVATK